MERKRKLVLDQTNAEGSNSINPWTEKPYSQKYYEIYEKRTKLPVWEQRNEFFNLINNNQVIVFVGETGSGKTTQVSLL
jgi:HrpA-like RNA helicase